MPVNYHTHTKRCCHASGTEEDYVREALKKGVVRLGFSDHAPFPDHDFGYRMPYPELKEYLRAIDRQKEIRQGQIQLYKGLEIEYLPRYRQYYQDLLSEEGLEYLALGEHYYMGRDGTIRNIAFAQSTEDYLDYAKAVCEAIETGWFRFAAHPDIMFANPFAADERSEEACRCIIQCAKEHDVILEYNANGLRRGRKPFPDGVRYPYPYEPFWEMVREEGLRVIVGSDCHTPEQICDFFFEDAVRRAEEAGLHLVDDIFEKQGSGDASGS